jgi:DNA-binding PadR family transcriptional regulator
VLALVEARARHGYEVAKLIERRSDGAVRFNVASSIRVPPRKRG